MTDPCVEWTSQVVQWYRTCLPMCIWSPGQENPLEEEMAPTAVFLPGESCGHRSLACCSLWGLKELDTTEWLSTHAVLHHMRGADTLRISKSSTENHLHQLGHVNCFDVWIPQKLSKKTLLDCISACDSLPKHNKNVLFLKQTVTDDEKWTLYSNVEWKRSWGKWNEPPPTIPQRKSSSKEGGGVYTVGLEGSPPLWASPLL